VRCGSATEQEASGLDAGDVSDRILTVRLDQGINATTEQRGVGE
jgi:hypothetical protein